MTEINPATSASAGVVLLSSGRFFVRTVPLAAVGEPGRQVALAAENLAPFPLNQLYYGWVPAAKQPAALVFAAYRKQFSAEEAAGWAEAAAVLPEFLVLLGDPPDTPTVRVWRGKQGVAAAAWNGTDELPLSVVVADREDSAESEQIASLVAELKARTGLASAGMQEFTGPLTAAPMGKGGLSLRVEKKSPLTTLLDAQGLASADVRDKEFLAVQRAMGRRDLRLWRIFVGCAIGLAAMLACEAGLAGGRAWLQNLQQTIRSQASVVQRIETAQALSTRIEETTQRQLLPFEMLALINQSRPAAMQFVRITTTGLHSLEIEAQTPQAADVARYEAALRAAPELAGAEARDLRTREGVTSFILSVKFKPDAVRREAGS